MAQTWSNLLFAHWPMVPDRLRPLIPAGLTLDIYDSRAWVGVVPFYMSHVRVRGLPPVPGTDRFCELNVRTYVTDGTKPGVWFFSLDASNALAVRGARRFFALPYFNALMSLQQYNAAVHYVSQRRHPNAAPAIFEALYRPISALYHSRHGTLLHWLTERYCLYAADEDGRIYRGEIHHLPWSLQDATADIRTNTMAQAAGIDLPDEALLHFAEQLEVAVWYIERI